MGNRSANRRSFNTIRHSNREERIKRRRQGRFVLFSICTVLMLLVLTALIFVICLIANSCERKSPNGEPVTPPPSVTIQYETATRQNKAARSGELILVNTDHEYLFPSADKNSRNGMEAVSSAARPIASDGKAIYQVVNGVTVYLQPAAKQALDAMIHAYYEASGDYSITLKEGFRDYDKQNENFTGGSTQTKPGFSDHHTGYLVNFASLSQEQSDWLNRNASKYGFVQRYSVNHDSHTGVSGYVTAYRYVGIPHATYMAEHGLCLEEYVDLLSAATAENHLTVTAGGVNYEIYTVPVSSADADGETLLQLPTNYGYSVSGDNAGNFVVTVNLNDAVNKNN